MTKPRILLLMLEYRNWHDASRWAYSANFGFEEGFDANGIEYLSLPVMYGVPTYAPTSWLARCKELIGNTKFDQVWFELVHSTFDEPFLDWLKDLAPIRVGILCESLEPDPREMFSNREGTLKRLKNREKNFSYATHILMVDEKDVAEFNTRGSQPAFWWIGSKIPQRYVSETYSPPLLDKAVFYGTLYGDRKVWLEHPALHGLLVRPERSADELTEYPALYEKINSAAEAYLAGMQPVNRSILDAWAKGHRAVRRAGYKIWLEGLKVGSAIVNLPQFGNAYASRVIEGLSVARPVISHEIPNRPKTKELFRDGEEILLYAADNPEQLAEQIKRVLGDPSFARRIAERGRDKILRFHTNERMVSNVMNWLEAGTEPRYID